MSRREQWLIEFRVGPGEQDGRRGLRLHQMPVDPSLCAWFRGLLTNPSAPIDPRLGSFHVYVNDELASSITSGDLPPATVGPTDLARVEQLRGEASRLEARAATLSGQVGADEARLRSTQAELVALEARVAVERDRLTAVLKHCDDEIVAARKSAADEKEQIRKDLATFREEMLATRKDVAEVFEGMRTLELEELKYIARRRTRAQEQLADVVDACADLEDKALSNALTGAARPTAADQAERLGINVNSVAGAIIQIYDRVQKGGAVGAEQP